MEHEEQGRKIEKIIAKAWMDEGFKQRLLSDPVTSLKEEGVEIPPGVEVRVMADTDNLRHLVLPLKPSSKELLDKELARIVAGRLTNRPHPTDPINNL